MPRRQYPPACSAYNPDIYNPDNYLPSLAPGVIFSILFGIISLTQLFHTVRTRAWWMFFFTIGAGLDCMGWIGRTVLHECPYQNELDTMQIATLIMGPAWTQAGVYITLWLVIKTLGEQVSPVSAKLYLWACVCIDIVCLALQATGGGLAGAASDEGRSTQPGTTTMVIGIITQLVCAFIFSVFAAIVVLRGLPAVRASRSISIVVAAMTLSTAMMILRGVYRSIELVQGWAGNLIVHEVYIIVLDAVPMVIAMGTWVVCNPGKLFERHAREEEKIGPEGLGNGAGIESAVGQEKTVSDSDGEATVVPHDATSFIK